MRHGGKELTACTVSLFQSQVQNGEIITLATQSTIRLLLLSTTLY